MTETTSTALDPAWWSEPAARPSVSVKAAASERQNQLTKPPGALGRLEQIAIQLAAIQNQVKPSLEQVHIAVFAGDHGIVEEGVSAFPQAVTVEMQRNFIRGGAAISVLARELDATLEVINTGTHADPSHLAGVVHGPIAPQTANFRHQAAMTEAQWQQALCLGWESVQRAAERGVKLYIGGEMGIGNTTAATALLARLLNLAVGDITGPGTGLNQQGVQHKIRVIQHALDRHTNSLTDAGAISRILGGFEITALTGAYIAAAQQGIAVIVDGFICTAAAAVALQLNPSIRPYLFFSHCSAEPGHQKVIEQLGVEPIVDLNLRLGEGSGAAMVVPLLRLACALHNQMATFAEAAVSEKLENG
ncbi:nicotinate-nucleotide--dimethylbenzimidazole phosphoribosyltransferase [Ketobacter sp.]|uniref:nicotinate-nucleotide--dimethylbenzimidazole phosphoribosyltransferase n=1 Tax=Ketobacter sp. TaxID=2083498 RepID=UPI000F18331D|nr:nicotinate-nucleotide--dimethylbenzimidazole phosphoribosyltransferase [Ketobacter sp.]RLU00396.1 MAG: nicotinate-nucleotide--dimethylbenzimidazole phosphoribosyltransferase [Ketobacter sp.]